MVSRRGDFQQKIMVYPATDVGIANIEFVTWTFAQHNGWSGPFLPQGKVAGVYIVEQRSCALIKHVGIEAIGLEQ
jgi:hypothetical protein